MGWRVSHRCVLLCGHQALACRRRWCLATLEGSLAEALGTKGGRVFQKQSPGSPLHHLRASLTHHDVKGNPAYPKAQLQPAVGPPCPDL